MMKLVTGPTEIDRLQRSLIEGAFLKFENGEIVLYSEMVVRDCGELLGHFILFTDVTGVVFDLSFLPDGGVEFFFLYNGSINVLSHLFSFSILSIIKSI